MATEDRGEGIFLQLDEERVASWEERVLSSEMAALRRLELGVPIDNPNLAEAVEHEMRQVEDFVFERVVPG